MNDRETVPGEIIWASEPISVEELAEAAARGFTQRRKETPNPSGITPTEFKVLILPKQVEEKVGSIFLPAQKQEAEKYATMEGTLIAASPLAFTYANKAEWELAGATPPQPGQRIIFAKYSGVRQEGRDGVEYILANDKDVLATLDD